MISMHLKDMNLVAEKEKCWWENRFKTFRNEFQPLIIFELKKFWTLKFLTVFNQFKVIKIIKRFKKKFNRFKKIIKSNPFYSTEKYFAFEKGS